MAEWLAITAVSSYTNRSDGKVVSVTDCSVKWRVRSSLMNAAFQCRQGHCTAPLSMNGITGPTESISFVNLVKMVNMPLA